MFCKRCGSEVGPGDNFCKRCGAPAVTATELRSSPGAPALSRRPAPTKRRLLLIAALCALLLLGTVAGVTVVLTAGGRQESSDEVSESGKIITSGEETVIASATIANSGGTITVDRPGDPLNGLELQVPAGAYPGGTAFRVTETAIVSTTFGSDFHPETPLIGIKGGEGYAEEIMLLKIPLDLQEGRVAGAFYYDDVKGELEGLPPAYVENGGITVATRHFSKLVVSSMDETLLQKRIDRGIQTRFEPGRDDWQFKNTSTYPATRGICSGMSVSALYYFQEKSSKGSPVLYGLYDNQGGAKTPDFWQDDRQGLRLASVVQGDIAWDTLQEKIANSIKAGDRASFMSVAYSLYVSRKPVFLLLRRTGGGHAVVAYGMSSGRILIADPSYPGEERSISFTNNAFQSYRMGSFSYSTIINMGAWSMVSGILPDRWEELEDGRIGSGTFPSYALEAQTESGQWTALSDGFATSAGSMNVRARAVATEGPQEISVIPFKGTTELARDQQGFFTLESGTNELGFMVQAKIFGADEWVDFKRVVVERRADRTLQVHHEYFASGKLSREYSYYLDAGREIMHGFDTVYTESGFPSSKSHYVDGQRDGLQTMYYADSNQPSRTWEMKQGVLDGTTTEYRQDGTISLVVEYKDGVEVPGSRRVPTGPE